MDIDEAEARSTATSRSGCCASRPVELARLMELTDQELCAMVARHDEQAFELLVQRHRAHAYRIAYSVLGNEVDTREISQDAFIRLFKSAHKFDGRSRFSTSFYRILVNLCIDHKQRQWLKKMPPQAGPVADPLCGEEKPDAATARHLFSGRLGNALKRLSDNQRMAVLLRVQEGFSSPEIAEVLNCSEKTARVYSYRGLTALKSCLEMNSDAGRPS